MSSLQLHSNARDRERSQWMHSLYKDIDGQRIVSPAGRASYFIDR